MIALFERLFGWARGGDLAAERKLAAGILRDLVPSETCRNLRHRSPEGDWHFTVGRVLRVDEPIVVYGWRQHDGKVKVHRLDRSLEAG